jgi:uncharacterized protein (DUF1810 family)
MTSASDLERFRAGYRHDFDTALAEINRGRKRSHWMWFTFPQVAGLGSSPTAAQYAIGSRSEAEAFLRDPTLGPSYRHLVEAVWQQVVGNGVSVRALFGQPDDQKLVSSLTLFGTVAAGLGEEWAPTVFKTDAVLDVAADQGAGDEQRQQGSGGEERPERVRLVASPNQHESEPGDSGESEPGNESDGDGPEADVAEVDAEQQGEPNVAVTEAAGANEVDEPQQRGPALPRRRHSRSVPDGRRGTQRRSDFGSSWLTLFSCSTCSVRCGRCVVGSGCRPRGRQVASTRNWARWWDEWRAAGRIWRRRRSKRAHEREVIGHRRPRVAVHVLRCWEDVNDFLEPLESAPGRN